MADDPEIDALTGVANRRRLLPVLAEKLERGELLALALIDIDSFKHFNMHNGYIAGDATLRALARILESQMRDGDAVYRVAGEQFLVTMPNDVDTAAAQAELLRAAVEDQLTPPQPEHCGDPHCLGPVRPLTVSIGVVAMNGMESVTAALAAAQEAVERAKWAGRNRVAT